jgi:peptidoglycan/LPS O-acetylase OafA/YrhL
MRQDRSRIPALDGLRLFAALAVVAYHYTGYGPAVRRSWGVPAFEAFPGLSAVTQYGRLGVELFFLISGFVICMSAWGRDLGAFVRSRVTRLFPAYWAAVLLTTGVVALFSTQYHHVSGTDLLVNLTMLETPMGVPVVDGVYWTLWVEACFYLLFAFVVWRGLTRRRVVAFCFLWLAVAVLCTKAPDPLVKALVQPTYAPYFIAGIAFYLIHRFGSDLKLWGLIGACFALSADWVASDAVAAGKAMNQPMPAAPAVAAVAAFYGVMALVALGKLSHIRWRWLTTAGILTYPLYLVHELNGWVLIHALRTSLPQVPRYALLAVVTAVALIGAWLLHRLVERPVAGLLRRRLAPAAAVINQRRAPDPRDEKPVPDPRDQQRTRAADPRDEKPAAARAPDPRPGSPVPADDQTPL